MTRPALKVDSPNAPTIAPPRGPMVDARTIATDMLSGTVTEAWVRANVPGRVKLSHRTVRWYRVDVEQWITSLRKAG